jgi:hypothetical protein
MTDSTKAILLLGVALAMMVLHTQFAENLWLSRSLLLSMRAFSLAMFNKMFDKIHCM